MAEKKQTIIEEALLDMQKIEQALKANSKEILRSLMKEEIEGYVKESIGEAENDFEEEEIDDAGEIAADEPGTGEKLPFGNEPTGDGEEVAELPLEGGEEDVDGLEDDSIDLDMTGASDDDVIAVYKKLSGSDEIEVVSKNEVKITDPQSGNQYVVKLGGEGLEGGAPAVPAETEIGDDEIEISDDEVEIGNDEEEIENDETEIANDEEETEEDDELGESVVYEIELQDDEDVNEDIVRGAGHDTEVKNSSAPNTGDIEGQKAPLNNEIGDNLEGGFDEDVTSGDGHAEHVMEEVEEETDEQPIEEKIQVGKARRVANGKTTIEGPGAKANNVQAPNVTANESVVKKYNALVKEAAQLKKENEEFRTSLKKFRDMLTETVVFNSNLAHVVKLFTEHTTTKDEKKSIITRFDETASIKESKQLYKTIVGELNNKKTVTESVEEKINKESGSSKTQISESTVYVDKSTARIKDLIARVEGRK